MAQAKSRREIMQIKLVISTDTLGDSNAAEENQRYADAVKNNISDLYPLADVDVSLSDNPCDAGCFVSGSESEHNYDVVTDSNYDVAEHVDRVKASVWDRGNY
jgi:hypothetical protein